MAKVLTSCVASTGSSLPFSSVTRLVSSENALLEAVYESPFEQNYVKCRFRSIISIFRHMVRLDLFLFCFFYTLSL